MEKQTSLEKEVALIWPGIFRQADKMRRVRIIINSDLCYNIGYFMGSKIIEFADVHTIVDYLREKNSQIGWHIYKPKGGLKNNNFIKKIEFILNCICNGDELILNDQHNTIDDTEYILEAFRGVRFSAIKIDIQKNDELLQFIHKITHAPIYYTDIHTWSLFESED